MSYLLTHDVTHCKGLGELVEETSIEDESWGKITKGLAHRFLNEAALVTDSKTGGRDVEEMKVRWFTGPGFWGLEEP